MRDPFETEPTPYELLGVEPGATPQAVEQAFGAAVRHQPARVNRLKLARDLLKQRPRERALVDLLLYDDAGLAAADPNPLVDPDALTPARRAETAAAWEGAFYNTCPDPVAGHNLAVLWYWWAVHAEEQESAGQGGEVIKCWQRAIAYWVMLLATPEFLAVQAQRCGTSAQALRSDLTELLSNRLHEGVRSHRNAGNDALAERYRGLALALATELRVADDLAAIGIRTARGPLCCGPMLLGLQGRMSALRGKVKQALERRPEDSRLLRLDAALSPYAAIAVLLDQNRSAQALEALDALPAAEQAAREVQTLRARALYAQGTALGEHGQLAEALQTWSKAAALSRRLSLSPPEDFAQRMAGLCAQHALALQDRDLGEAIELLARGLVLAEDAKLAATLAELLTRRAEQRLARPGGADGEAGDEALRLALADLERAEELGYERAADQAARVRQSLWQRLDYAVLPEAVAARARAAERADRAQQWEVALEHWQAVVSHLRRALPAADREEAVALRRSQVTSLVHLATAKFRRGLGLWDGEADEARERLVLSLFEGARDDLDEAVVLDPESTLASAQRRELGAARATLRRAMEQRRLLKWANEAAGRQDWSGACAFLTVALEDAPAEQQPALSHQLAAALANLSVHQINRVMEQMRASVMEADRISGAFSEVYEAYVELAYAVTLHFDEPTLAKHLQDASEIQGQLRALVEQLGGKAKVTSAEQLALRNRETRAEAWRRRVSLELETRPERAPKPAPRPAAKPRPAARARRRARKPQAAPGPPPEVTPNPRSSAAYAWTGALALVSVLATWGLAGVLAPELGAMPKAVAAVLLGGPLGWLLATLQARVLLLWRAGGSHAWAGLVLGLLVMLPAYAMLGLGLMGLYSGPVRGHASALESAAAPQRAGPGLTAPGAVATYPRVVGLADMEPAG